MTSTENRRYHRQMALLFAVFAVQTLIAIGLRVAYDSVWLRGTLYSAAMVLHGITLGAGLGFAMILEWLVRPVFEEGEDEET